MFALLKEKLNVFKSPKRIKVGSHEVEEEIMLSEGGYGYIWRVKDTTTGEFYALKKSICQSKERLKTAKNEISALKGLPEHPNIIKYVDSEIVSNGGESYLALLLVELCEGGSLVDLLGKYEKARLKESQLIFLMKQVSAAIAVLHEQDPPLAHRDLKVENIILHRKQFKICDFGSASKDNIDVKAAPKEKFPVIEEEFEKNTTLMYRPPEMCDLYQGYPINEKVDIWMLGCVLFVVCFYKHPFMEASKLAIVNAAFQIPEKSNYSEKMHDLIRFMLTPDPKLRPSIREVIEVLEKYDELENIPLNSSAKEIKENQKKIMFEAKIPRNIENSSNKPAATRKAQQNQQSPNQLRKLEHSNKPINTNDGFDDFKQASHIPKEAKEDWDAFQWEEAPKPEAVVKTESPQPAPKVEAAFNNIWAVPEIEKKSDDQKNGPQDEDWGDGETWHTAPPSESKEKSADEQQK